MQQKKFSTFSEQVELLQTEKHIVISDTAYAEDVLNILDISLLWEDTNIYFEFL